MKITIERLKKIPSYKILKIWIEWLNNKKVSNSIHNLPIEIKKQKQFFDLFKTILNRKL